MKKSHTRIPSAGDATGISKDPSWHSMKTEAVLEALGSDGDGISSQQAETSRKLYGLNRLPEPKRTNPVLRFFKHFQNILIYMLLGSSAITGFLGHWTDTFVILAVVFANAAIGFVQEGKAEKAMDAIRGMLANKASVMRDGVRQAIDSELLVPGDIVLIEAGNKIPADLRLTQAHGLHIQESILTGESLPSEKHIQPVEVEAPTGDRKCMAYSGTIVTSGSGCGVVVGTGAKTEIGRISCMLSGVSTLTTPLVQQMNVFAKWLTMLILLIAGVLLVFGYYVEHFEFSYVFMAVVGLSVAAIPEGLPAVLTITLAAGVQAMAKRRAIVRRLPAIETLGSVSVICSDKTGTLTRNEMMVVTVATGNREFSIEGNGYNPEGSIRLNGGTISGDQFPDLWELAGLSILCNDAALVHRDSDKVWLVEGDPMEGALLAFAAKTGMDPEKRRTEWTRIDTIPFDSRHRFMATLNHDARHGLGQAAVKGAPEHILEKCQHQRCIDGSTSPIQTDFWRVKLTNLQPKGNAFWHWP